MRALKFLTAGAVLLSTLTVAPAAPVVSHWTFDEGSGGTAADSAGSHSLTLHPGAGWAAGQVGSHSLALSGNGFADNAAPAVDTSASFTVSAWVNLASLNGYQTVVSIDGGQVSAFYLQLRGDTGTFALTRLASDSTSAATTIAAATFTPQTGTWYHLVGVDDVAAGKLSLYVNGALQSTSDYVGGWRGSGATAIGRGKYGGNPVDFVNGQVDDVSMYGSALSADQVAALDHDAHWNFDGTGADVSGHGHDAVVHGSYVAGTVGPQALNGSATVSGSVVDTSQPFSVSAWVQSGSVFSLGGVKLGVDGFTDQGVTVKPTSPLAARWQHIVGVQDNASKQLRLYVNGALQGTVAFSGAVPSTGDTVLGPGIIDDVRVYDHPLNGDEAQALYTKGVAQLTVDTENPGPTVSPDMFGLFLEDINHSGEGGLYAEQIQNRSMMAAATPAHWSAVHNGTIALDPSQPLNAALTRSLKLQAPGGIANDGFWGIPVAPGATWTASFFAKAAGKVPLTVDVEGTDGTVYASASVKTTSADWKQYTVALKTSTKAPKTTDARFVISTAASATVWFDQVSLMPPTYRNHGLRVDLMQKLAALRPAFFRVPGGNYLEGNTIATRFDWKKTIGPAQDRPGHMDDAWGYWSTDGLGLLEYLEMAEDLGAKPVLAIYAGYSLDGEHVSADQLGPYVQDALDELEYATGPVTSTWGAKRAADGHPAPFRIDRVEIGNEDWLDRSGSYPQRYAPFYDALHSAYPQLKFIATTAETARPYDLIDDHYYQSPSWFEANSHHYDTAARGGPQVFVGEYASRSGNTTPNLNDALGDASWLAGLLRDGDLVRMVSYAPLLVNLHDVAWQTDLIGFDGLSSYGSVSYYAQQMLATRHGDTVIPTTATNGLQTVTTRSGNTLYVAVVNPTSVPRETTVTLRDVSSVRDASATVLTGPTGSATNTITSPTTVSPVTRQLGSTGPAFTHTFPALSLTILQVTLR